jgi:putative transposase
MDLRAKLIQDYEEGESITDLGEIYGISRTTIYKWLERYDRDGLAGLADHSRAPLNRPQQVSEAITARIVEARQRWKWGARKLLAKLRQAHPEETWPAPSTVADLLRRRGLTHARRKRLRTPLYSQPLAEAEEANRTWCADFKGWFRTGDGTRCDPLTLSDKCTRYLLRCQITPKADTAHVEAIFDAAFEEYGLPDRIHTDNGAPFASRAPGGLSRLSMRWVKLGIVPERSRPAMPQDNGRHERFHLTLKQEVLGKVAAHPRAQQEVFREFQQLYNFERPHEALEFQTPGSRYVPSSRRMPRRVPELTYNDDIRIRRVSTSGELNWKGTPVFVSEVFRGENLGLHPIDDRYLQVWFGPIALGWIDQRRQRFQRKPPRRRDCESPWK